MLRAPRAGASKTYQLHKRSYRVLLLGQSFVDREDQVSTVGCGDLGDPALLPTKRGSNQKVSSTFAIRQPQARLIEEMQREKELEREEHATQNMGRAFSSPMSKINR